MGDVPGQCCFGERLTSYPESYNLDPSGGEENKYKCSFAFVQFNRYMWTTSRLHIKIYYYLPIPEEEMQIHAQLTPAGEILSLSQVSMINEL